MAKTYKEAIPVNVLDQVTDIYCSGNGFKKNVLLRRISGDVFGKQLIVSNYNEEAALGAAIFVKDLSRGKQKRV